MFCWGAKTRYIDAPTEKEASDMFQERYGFWPSFVMKLETNMENA